MLLAMSSDIRILLIKLADRLHNMRTLSFVSEDRARQIAQETQDIYVPLAHRLGIHWMKHELEDLAFRVLEPVGARDLERRLRVQAEGAQPLHRGGEGRALGAPARGEPRAPR